MTTDEMIAQIEDQDWTMVIEPRRRLLDLHLGELWRYRDLVLLFVRRDFVSVYKQTILGPLWYLIQPLLTTITFTVIFGNIAKLSTDGLPQFLFYMSGTVIWTYFASCLTKTSETFVSNAALFGKVYFPRLAVPVSILLSNLIAFFIQFAFFLAFMLYFALTGAQIPWRRISMRRRWISRACSMATSAPPALRSSRARMPCSSRPTCATSARWTQR